MKHTAKRLLAGLLTLALLLPAMAACKKDPDGTPDNPNSDPIEAAVREKVTHVYKGDYVAVPEKISLNSRISNSFNIFQINSSIDFDFKIITFFFFNSFQSFYLFKRRLNKFLSAKSRIHRHYQNHIHFA